jgi:hypothetical protein
MEKPFTSKLSELKFGKRKYRTRPLEEVLEELLKDKLLFGGVHESPARCLQMVAVTAATDTVDQAIIFTNYNRAYVDQISVSIIIDVRH